MITTIQLNEDVKNALDRMKTKISLETNHKISKLSSVFNVISSCSIVPPALHPMIKTSNNIIKAFFIARYKNVADIKELWNMT